MTDTMCPPLDKAKSQFGQNALSLPRGGVKLMDEDSQKSMLRRLEAITDIPEPDIDALCDIRAILDDLWASKSDYILPAAELLANGSRNPAWRLLYNYSGILDFFLRLLASTEQIDNIVLLHSLRLVGNSCADTDENRRAIVDGDYTPVIIAHSQNPSLIHVVIPVVYNLCLDFAPAQSKAAECSFVHKLLSLINDNAIHEDALLDFSYELIELLTQDERAEAGIAQSPDDTLSLLTELAARKDIAALQFFSVASCLAAYLERKRFQDACISGSMVDQVLTVLERTTFIDEVDLLGSTQSMIQLQLKINQVLADVSASPLFTEAYPLDSPLTQTLKSWLTADEDQLQVCACVMLGNLARSDEVCARAVRDLGVHKDLISILKGDAKTTVLHSVLGFLKNLAIASDNKLHLGDAGIIPAISHLWSYETVPQIQFSAVSLLRQVVISSTENISRFLNSQAGSDSSQTYLSLLLSLFERTDSVPIKIEVGRIIASACRTISSKPLEQNETNSLLERLYTQHKAVANPIGTMITQTQWPAVRSEGWFVLALMASSPLGCRTVVSCLQESEVFEILERAWIAEEDPPDVAEWSKDRDNMAIFAQELFTNGHQMLSTKWKDKMEELTSNHILRYLKSKHS